MAMLRGKAAAFSLQVALMLLPTLLLAAVGFYFLQHDRTLVEQDARDRATAAANLLARTAEAEWMNALASTSGAVEFEYDTERELIDPAPLIPIPPSLNFPDAPADLANAAEGSVTNLQTHLCRLQLLATREMPPDILCRWLDEGVAHPSILTPKLLAAADHTNAPACLAELRSRWERHEETRWLANLWRNYLLTTASANESHLIARSNRLWRISLAPNSATRFRAVDLNTGFTPRLTQFIETGLGLPPFLGAAVYIDNREVTQAPRNWMHSRSNAPAGLPSSTWWSEAPAELSSPIRARIALINPELLFAHQQSRARWIAALIAGSALASLIGSLVAFRTFRREQQLSEMKSNFVASVSHELRAPIASVQLLSEGLHSGRVRDPEKQREYFDFIVQECRRLSRLIENVLDFSRMERGRKEYHIQPANPAAVVAQAVKTLEPLIRDRQILLEQSVQPGDASFDPAALCQALVNLLDNALKHSTPGSRVSIGCNVDSAGCQFWVEDEGPGIPKHEHAKIFERFYRVGSELTREREGAGIGLSIVKHIVDAHRGHITLRSAPSQGARFTLFIPHRM